MLRQEISVLENLGRQLFLDIEDLYQERVKFHFCTLLIFQNIIRTNTTYIYIGISGSPSLFENLAGQIF